MSLALRNSRKIAVDGANYRWAVSPDSGVMLQIVQHADGKGQKLEVSFDYADKVQKNGRTRQSRTVSSRVVRAIILHSLTVGWQPKLRNAKPLRVDGDIAMRTAT